MVFRSHIRRYGREAKNKRLGNMGCGHARHPEVGKSLGLMCGFSGSTGAPKLQNSPLLPQVTILGMPDWIPGDTRNFQPRLPRARLLLSKDV